MSSSKPSTATTTTTTTTCSNTTVPATPPMCHHAFSLLHHALDPKRSSSKSPPKPPPTIPNVSTVALFVTLKKLTNQHYYHHPHPHHHHHHHHHSFFRKSHRKPQHYTLRGCIGTLTPTPSLHSALNEYTSAAAFRDRRFAPLNYSELPYLQITVSLLSEFKLLEPGDYYNWEIGIHGLIVEFDHYYYQQQQQNNHRHHQHQLDIHHNHKKYDYEYSATYLPEICKEQGWTKEECLKSLILKSGWKGKINKYLLKKIRITTYKSSRCIINYDQWIHYLKYENRMCENNNSSDDDHHYVLLNDMRKDDDDDDDNNNVDIGDNDDETDCMVNSLKGPANSLPN